MSHHLRQLAGFGALALLLLSAGCGKKVEEELLFPVDHQYAKWIGKHVGEINFTALDGREVTLRSLHGRVVLLDFWATWCGPCMAKLPELKDAYNELHPKGFEVIGVSFDVERGALERVVKQHDIPWPQFFGGRDNQFGQRFGITHFPSMWLVDQDGFIRYISAGADLRGKVMALLKKGPTTPYEIERPKPKAFSLLKLKGVTANSLALINAGTRNYNFNVNEEHQIETAAGIIRLKCVGISAKGAAFLVDDYPTPLELRLDDKTISMTPR
ncbi:MAG: TlpA family protein disulfide reductase [Verrucomicrobia bacterium]|nr:TlpA family protein disulfide reductase [Verrucomicrobiota bacterium]